MTPAPSSPSSPATLVLDNEAVQALLDVAHRKHRRVLAFVDEVNRRDRHRRRTTVLVPVAVRVEAGWDRTDPTAASVNRLSRAQDVPLDGRAADRATRLRRETGVSVVDATVGQALEAAAPPVAVLTSDTQDVRRLAAASGTTVRVIRI